MDPNECLSELLELSTENCDDRDSILFESMQRGGELFLELEEWFTKGGFVPTLWQVPPTKLTLADDCARQASLNAGRKVLVDVSNKFIASDGCCSTGLGLKFFRLFLKFHGLLIGGAPLPSLWKGEVPE